MPPKLCHEPRRARPFVFLHVGDLHITALRDDALPAFKQREHQLEADLRAIFADIAAIEPNKGFDFVYLPGDLAENAHPDEYKTLTALLARHPDLEVRLIPGDHDIARGTMDDFRRFRAKLKGAQKQADPMPDMCIEEPLPVQKGPPSDCLTFCCKEQFFYACDYRGVRCLFLDMVSAGYGQKGKGLDFRLGKGQTKWLENEVAAAKAAGTPCAIFMHCYPADMHEPDEAGDLAGLIWDGGVSLVEMGHTHYNEIAHDGRTQYATARSIGQNEDGPVGYAVVALDDGVTSWRYKQLQQTWPFVLITSPADRRLASEPLHVSDDGKILVRALILTDQPPLWGTHRPDLCDPPKCKMYDEPERVDDKTPRYKGWCSVDGGEWQSMTYVDDNMFELCVEWRPGSKTVSVNVTDGRWMSRMKDFIDQDTIEPAPTAAHFTYKSKPAKPEGGASRVGAWPVKGVRGDQLGPNSGGRKW